MAHSPKPFYRSARNAWYVQIGTQQIKLAEGPKNSASEKQAWLAFHQHMSQAKLDSKQTSRQPSNDFTVGELFEKYLEWCQINRSQRTYEWSRGHIQNFCDHFGNASAKTVDTLRPFHVSEWINSKTTWGANYRRGAIIAVQRAFNWARQMGYVEKNPVEGVEKPPAQKRESHLTPEKFTELISFVKDKEFLNILTFAYETGVRPQEATCLEARHVRLEVSRIEIPPVEAKGKRRWRIIYLSDKAKILVRELVQKYPDGKLFRNTDGNDWNRYSLNCRFQRLKKKMGQRFAMYDIRHCFATRKLKEGYDPITVATLLGHKDAAMLCKHYEELSRDSEHLRKAVN